MDRGADGLLVLLVVLVPRLVQTKYVSTALGAHKSVSCSPIRVEVVLIAFLPQLEQTGTVISQTIAGLVLDKGIKESASPFSTDGHDQLLLRTFLVSNGVQLGGILLLWHLNRRRDVSTRWRGSRHSIPRRSYAVETTDDDDPADRDESYIPLEQFQPEGNDATHSLSSRETIPIGTAESSSRRRGMFFGGACALLVAAAWILFIITAWLRLRSKSERGSGGSSREWIN